MALVGNFLPAPTVLTMPSFSKLQKPKTMIVCRTPDKPGTGTGRGGQIHTTLRLSKKTLIGVNSEVTPNTTQHVEEDHNQKSKANYSAEDAAAAGGGGNGQGAKPTD